MSAADTPRMWPPCSRSWTLLVVGCGLIGGSIALAARARWPAMRIAVLDRAPVLRRVGKSGLVDETVSLKHLVPMMAELRPAVVVVALPIDAILEFLPRLAKASSALAKDARPLIIDVGSVKKPIVEGARACKVPRFVGGHPLAGSDRGGFSAASRELLRDRTFALCPLPRRPQLDIRQAQGFVRALGGRPLVLSAVEHDDWVAMTSHVPHVIATTLMHWASRQSHGKRGARRGLPWTLAAGAWRDATRVAAADAELWAPIFHHNHRAVVRALEQWIELLQGACAALEMAPHGLEAAGIDPAAMARLRRQIATFLPSAPGPDLHAPARVRHASNGFGQGR